MLALDDLDWTCVVDGSYGVGTTAAMSAVIKLSLPVGLLALYVVGALIWYELLRSQLVDLLAWRRRRRGRQRRRRRRGRSGEAEAAAAVQVGDAQLVQAAEAGQVGPGQVEPGQAERVESTGGTTELEAVDGSGDDARMHYYLARKAAAAERDAAIEAANEATKRAIERIEQRYGQTRSAEDDVSDAAKAERDAAVEAANAAAKQAIERIGQRYREIDWALEDEEAERIRQMLERAER